MGFAAALLAGTEPGQARDALSEFFEEEAPARWQWLDQFTVAENELWRVGLLFVSLLVAFVLGRVIRFFLNMAANRFERRQRHLMAVALRAAARSAVFLMLVLGLKAGLEFLVLNPTVDALATSVSSVLMTVAIGYTAYCLVSVVDEWLRQMSEKTVSRLDDMLVPLVRKSLRATIAIMVLVQVATILSDKPVTSIIAGLGVGGLAVGLAAQDTIKNFFGSMMIFSDRPFEMGDEIIVDSLRGSIEAVGFRSTRFRTGDGHLVTIPNGELASKAIINVSKRGNLTRSLNLALSYDLPPERLDRAVAVVKEILHEHEGLRPGLPPRVYLSDFTPSALNLLVTYWYHPADWWKYVAFNERVNLQILSRFREEQITLAYPTQTVRLHNLAPDPAASEDGAAPPAGAGPNNGDPR